MTQPKFRMSVWYPGLGRWDRATRYVLAETMIEAITLVLSNLPEGSRVVEATEVGRALAVSEVS